MNLFVSITCWRPENLVWLMEGLPMIGIGFSVWSNPCCWSCSCWWFVDIRGVVSKACRGCNGGRVELEGGSSKEESSANRPCPDEVWVWEDFNGSKSSSRFFSSPKSSKSPPPVCCDGWGSCDGWEVEIVNPSRRPDDWETCLDFLVGGVWRITWDVSGDEDKVSPENNPETCDV